MRSDGLTVTEVIVGGCLLVLLLSALVALVLMFAWNLVMPDVFGLPSLDYLQAFGLMIVFNVIFGAVRNANSK